jgi:glycerol kinase
MRGGIDALQPGSAGAYESGVIFVPAHTGLGCPYWDRSARALWIGMDLATTREQLGMAVLEGVALRAAQIVPALDAVSGGNGRVRVDGGLSRNAYFMDFLAAALGRDIAVSDSPDLTAWGVIRLCRAAAGLPPGPAPRHRIVNPRHSLPIDVLGRFADAVERARRWVC